MNKLARSEMLEISGGGLVKKSFLAVIGAVAVFITGFVNGYQRPLTCSSSK